MKFVSLVCVLGFVLLGCQSGRNSENSLVGRWTENLHVLRSTGASPAELLQAARLRKREFQSLIRRNPEEAIRMAMPSHQRAQFPERVQREIEEHVELSGEIQMTIEEELGEDPKFLGNGFIFMDANKRIYQLQGARPGTLSAAKGVRVRGIRSDDYLLHQGFLEPEGPQAAVESQAGTQVGPSHLPPNPVVHVLLIDVSGGALPSPSSIQSIFTGSGKSVAAIFEETSYGQMTPQFHVAPYWHIQPVGCYGSSTLAENELDEAGILNIEDRDIQFVLIMKPQSCVGSTFGAAALAGNMANVTANALGSYSPQAYPIAHELLHVVGMRHHMELNTCFDHEGNLSAHSGFDNCPQKKQYGSFTVMGGGQRTPAASARSHVNWFPESQVTTVTGDSEVWLHPYNALREPGTTQMIRIPMVQDQTGTVRSYLTIERVEQHGEWDDYDPSDERIGGISAHIEFYTKGVWDQWEELGLRYPVGVDHDIEDSGFQRAMPVGKTLFESVEGIEVTHLSADEERSLVGIRFTDRKMCVRRPPMFHLFTVNSLTGTPGTTWDLPFVFFNDDSTYCGSSTFHPSFFPPENWTHSVDSSSYTLAPGEKVVRPAQVTAPPSTPDGDYYYWFDANDFHTNEGLVGNPGFRFSTYGGDDDTTDPTGSLTAPAPGATISGITTLSAIASDSPGSVGSVEFLVNGEVVAVRRVPPYSVQWDATSRLPGSYQIAARIKDSSDLIGQNEYTTPSVAVNVVAPNSVGSPVVHWAPLFSGVVENLVPIEIEVSSGVTIDRVEFRLNGQTIRVDNEFPFAWDLHSYLFENEPYVLTAHAYDVLGNEGMASTDIVILNQDDEDPILTVGSPEPASTHAAFEPIVFSASASDNLNFSSLKLYLDRELVEESNQPDLTFSWTPSETDLGRHTVHFVATDGVGNESVEGFEILVLPGEGQATAPSFINATQNRPDEIVVGWESVFGVSSYQVYRVGTGQECPSTNPLVSTADTRFHDQSVTLGDEYDYFVRAINLAGELSECAGPARGIASQPSVECTDANPCITLEIPATRDASLYKGAGDWVLARDADRASSITSFSGYLRLQGETTASFSSIWRSVISFNTQAIPADVEIVSAKLYLYFLERPENANNFVVTETEIPFDDSYSFVKEDFPLLLGELRSSTVLGASIAVDTYISIDLLAGNWLRGGTVLSVLSLKDFANDSSIAEHDRSRVDSAWANPVGEPKLEIQYR